MKIVPMKVKFRDLFPQLADIWYCRWAILRGHPRRLLHLLRSGVRADDRLLPVLRRGKERLQTSREIRHRGHGRGRGAGVLQQRRGLRGDGPDVRAGHPRIGGHGGPPGGADPLRPEARPDALRRERRFRLGGHGLDVHREHHPDRHEPAAGAALRLASPDPLRPDLPGDPDRLHRRRLRGRLGPLRGGADAGLRRLRLFHEEGRMSPPRRC